MALNSAMEKGEKDDCDDFSNCIVDLVSRGGCDVPVREGASGGRRGL